MQPNGESWGNVGGGTNRSLLNKLFMVLLLNATGHGSPVKILQHRHGKPIKRSALSGSYSTDQGNDF